MEINSMAISEAIAKADERFFEILKDDDKIKAREAALQILSEMSDDADLQREVFAFLLWEHFAHFVEDVEAGKYGE